MRRSACSARRFRSNVVVELLLLRQRLLQPLLVLFLIDAAQIDVLRHLEAGVLDGTRRDGPLRIVFRARLFLLRALLPNLLLQIAVLGPPVDGSFQLILPVEFHEELPGNDLRAAGHEPGDDERVAARGRRTDQPGRRDVVKVDGFDETGGPQGFDERTARDLQRTGCGLTWLILTVVRATCTNAPLDGERSDQGHQGQSNHQVRLFHDVCARTFD